MSSRLFRWAGLALAFAVSGCWTAEQRLLVAGQTDSFPGQFGIYEHYERTNDSCEHRYDYACYERKESVALESLIFVDTIVRASRNQSGEYSEIFLSIRGLSGGGYVVEQLAISALGNNATYGVASISDGEVRVWLPSCRSAGAIGEVVASRAGARINAENRSCVFATVSSLSQAAGEYRGYVRRTGRPPDSIYVYQRPGSRSSL
jgi:hypothetical protein